MQKGIFFISLFFLTFFVIWGNSMNLVNILPMDDFFEKYKISISSTESKKSKQYVFTDRKAGYFEGKTFSYLGGEGYKIYDTVIFRDFITLEDYKPLDRRKEATNAILYFYGIEHVYQNGIREEMIIPERKDMVVLHITADTQKTLSIVPIFNWYREDMEVEERGDVVIVSSKRVFSSKAPDVVYIKAFSDGKFERLNYEAMPELEKLMIKKTFAVPGRFSTKSPQKELWLLITFRYKKDGIERGVEEIRSLDPTMLVKEKKEGIYGRLVGGYFEVDDEELAKAIFWALKSADDMVVEEYGTGIWAGLPWFKNNWGRDTFISLPGTTLVNGNFTEAKQVILQFAKYQDTNENSKYYGRVPNYVGTSGAMYGIAYNTADGTLWFIREIWEYVMYSGDMKFLDEVYPVIKRFIRGAKKYWVDDKGLLTHGHAETWMDAQINGKVPWSPRGNRAIEIQALWINALRIAINIANMKKDFDFLSEVAELESLAVKNFYRLFFKKEGKYYYAYDRIKESGEPDAKIRPNQLMVIYTPFWKIITEEMEASILRNAINNLLFPYGITSLSPYDPDFHPYHFHPNYYKDAAYHNGVCWGWNAGFTISSLIEYGYTDLAFRFYKNLSRQILYMGCLGCMSELVNGLPRKGEDITEGDLSGTYDQTWSNAEFSRVWYQDFLGFRPNLIKKEINIFPAINGKITNARAVLRFGASGTAEITYEFKEKESIIKFVINGVEEGYKVNVGYLREDGDVFYMLLNNVVPGKVYTVRFFEANGKVNGEINKMKGWVGVYKKSLKGYIGELKFLDVKAVSEEVLPNLPCLKEKDYLMKKLLETPQDKL